MPTYCCARGCGNRHEKGGNLNFFRFPLKNEESVRLWLKAIGRENFTPSPASRVCSAHFLPSDYLVRPGAYIQRLKPTAVPSILRPPARSWEKKLKDINDFLENGTSSQVNAEAENVKVKVENIKREVETPSPVFEPEFISCDGGGMQTDDGESRKQIYAEIKQEPNENPSNPREQLEVKIHLKHCKDKKVQTNKCGMVFNADFLKRKIKVLQQKVRRQRKTIKRLRDSLKAKGLVNISEDIHSDYDDDLATFIVSKTG